MHGVRTDWYIGRKPTVTNSILFRWTVDFSLPTQTTDKAISQVFVFDANGDGYFDLCELDLNDNLINWIFYYNDGNNNFVDPQTVIYGMSEGDKKLARRF